MIELDELRVISVTGADAGRFLHNQLTVDVQGLAPDESRFAALCQPKGRVIALLLLIATDDGFRVLCHRDLAEGLLSHLRRFVFRDKVTLSLDASVAVLGGADADPGPDMVAPPLPGLAYGVGSGSEGDEADFHARELAAGVCWLTPATSEQFLPQMLGHEAIGALNFRKGCFPGQEVIARMRYLGKNKRHPWSGRVEGAPGVAPMDKLELVGGDQAASAVLVDARPLAAGGWQVLVVARAEEPFAVERLVAGDATLAATGRWINEALPKRG